MGPFWHSVEDSSSPGTLKGMVEVGQSMWLNKYILTRACKALATISYTGFVKCHSSSQIQASNAISLCNNYIRH